MVKYNIENELVKKQYEEYLKLDSRLSEKSIYAKLADIRKYEDHTDFESFKAFKAGKAIEFKEAYKKHVLPNGETLSFVTISRTLKNVKEFFLWLAQQPKYRSKVKASDTRAFNLSNKEENIARAKAYKDFPSLKQIEKVVMSMPTRTDIERRNQAMIAFTILTGVRVHALISLQLGHVDEFKGRVEQDPRVVQTKFSKTIHTQFFPINGVFKEIVISWIEYLKEDKGFKLIDPLFPAILNEYDAESKSFIQNKLSREAIRSTTTAREIFKEAFLNANMKYYNPHSFRDTLVQLGERICVTPEQFKSWSQNLGHSSPLTTFTSYGEVHTHRQCEIIRNMSATRKDE